MTTRSQSKEPNVPRMFRGLSSRMDSKGGGNSLGARLEYNKGLVVQFLVLPDEFLEFDQHQFSDGTWHYVPCLGDDCPLCDDEDSEVKKTSYRFIAPIYSFQDKEVRVLEGPKTLAQKIAMRYSKKPELFLKRTFEVTKMKTTPVGYDVEVGEEAAIRTRTLEKPDLEDYIMDSAKRFFGDNLPDKKKSSRSSLDADDDDDDLEEEESSHTRAGLMDMEGRELKRLARKYNIGTASATRRDLVTAILRKER